MRGFALFFMTIVAASCGSKSTPTTPGSAAGSGSGAVGSAMTGSAATGSAATGSAATGSAATGSATDGSATAGSAAKLDPKFESLDPAERRTCGIYAECKVTRLRDDDPNAEDKKPTFENACLTVWVTLSAAEKKKIAKCADAVGQCLGPPPCFDSMKLDAH